MELSQLTAAVRSDAAWFVFANVLLQQIGLPVPAVPTLLVAGSLVTGPGQGAQVLLAAALASLLADWLWYAVGRAFGYRVLTGLCRLSLNPASCVSQTESRFVRWGLASLVVAKFIPGFSTVAPPIAGALRMSLPGFLAAAGVGAALWAGSALAAGWLFRAQLQELLVAMDGNGSTVVALLALLLALWLGWKLWQKFRFERLAAIPHISPDELLAALASPQPPLVLDLRGPTMVAATGPIPGAVAAEYDNLPAAVGAWPRSSPIVTLCACPADAGAIQAARALMARGYRFVRPLQGGFDALPAALRPGGETA